MYGINRVPADVDPTAEAIAELRALEITAELAARAHPESDELARIAHERHTDRWAAVGLRVCAIVGCPGVAPDWSEWGYCQPHTFERRAHEAGEEYPPTGVCAECKQSGSEWNAGAGAFLCGRHWDAY